VNATVRVHGLKDLQSALKKADGDLDKTVKDALREVGDIVKDDATGRGSRYAGIGKYRTVVRARGVAVEQSKGKVTGLRGDFGALQMNTVLGPALDENADEVEKGAERAIDKLIAAAGL
jgi:hypothetical protein